MAKTYSKPEIEFDSFALSQSINAGCEYISNLSDRSSCSVPGNIYDLSDYGFSNFGLLTGCKWYCYSGPADDRNVYSS